MLLEELRESRHWDIETVIAIMILKSLDLRRRSQPLCLVESLELGFRFGIDGVGQRSKRAALGAIKKSALLEKE